MSRDITLLHPEVQAIIPKFLQECKNQGLIVKITDTLRSKQEQDELYAQGRTKPGKIVTWVKYPYSNHNWGMAFDICRNDGKGAYYDADGWFKKVGQIGKTFGLIWGGDWKDSPDKPHFELTKYGSTTTLARKYGTPEKFKETWQVEGTKKYMFVNRNYKYNNKIKNCTVINENGENYIKIRDLAELLGKNIVYDSYTKITTLKDIFNKTKVEINGKYAIIQSLNVNDTTYSNTRELVDFLGFDTFWDNGIGTIKFKIKKTILDKLKILKNKK